MRRSYKVVSILIYWLVIFYLFLPAGYHGYDMSPEGMAQGSQIHVDKEK
ncbi:MAG: cytochrome c oxidase subunit 2A, partial [Deltaproteobacteria bacterium]|nr:cytochrome c oxidase subunit 2A [Deltaproteobacteria bacterium]